jgi:hypothetical protein
MLIYVDELNFFFYRFQQGRGFGGFLSGIFRSLKPLFKMGVSVGKKVLNSDAAKTIGRTALDIGKEAAKNVAVDVLSGNNVQESLDKELQSAKSKIAEKIKGSGRKRKRKQSHHTPNKRFCLLD